VRIDSSRAAAHFRLGVNYWPARTAMAWWSRYDGGEVSADFARIAAHGLDCARIFLTWEDFQPTPGAVDVAQLGRLVDVMDRASAAGLDVMPTLFTGHMSGVNWIPPWALGGNGGDRRFRVVASGRSVEREGLGCWYTDPGIVRAQELLAREVAGALAGHRALWAWDLGNENSNCVVPPDREHGRAWLQRVTGALRGADAGALVTIGLHMEDLAEDRRLGPREAAECCDFLTMHGYPGYAPWTAGPTDERLVPFLARLTRWLGGGAEVVFTELGVPTDHDGDPGAAAARAAATTELVSEDAAAAYLLRAITGLRNAGTTGALVWCHADYAESIWGEPPLDLAIHERSFGIFRADGSPKPAALALQQLAREPWKRPDRSPDDSWLDLDPADFEADPQLHLPRLFHRYVESVAPDPVTPPAARPAAR
jgi:endo-1,4-beta-mannosidase